MSMPKFVSVQSCSLDAGGNIQFRLDTADGKFYDLTFDLSFVPSMLTLLNKHFVESTQQRETTLIQEFVAIHQPESIALAVLPDLQQAMVVTTVSGMRIPLTVTPEGLETFSTALATLRPLIQPSEPPPDQRH